MLCCHGDLCASVNSECMCVCFMAPEEGKKRKRHRHRDKTGSGGESGVAVSSSDTCGLSVSQCPSVSFFSHLHFWLSLDLRRMSAWKTEEPRCCFFIRNMRDTLWFYVFSFCEAWSMWRYVSTFHIWSPSFRLHCRNPFWIPSFSFCSNRCLPVSHESEGGKLRGEEGGRRKKKRGAFVLQHWEKKKKKLASEFSRLGIKLVSQYLLTAKHARRQTNKPNAAAFISCREAALK